MRIISAKFNLLFTLIRTERRQLLNSLRIDSIIFCDNEATDQREKKKGKGTFTIRLSQKCNSMSNVHPFVAYSGTKLKSQ